MPRQAKQIGWTLLNTKHLKVVVSKRPCRPWCVKRSWYGLAWVVDVYAPFVWVGVFRSG